MAPAVRGAGSRGLQASLPEDVEESVALRHPTLGGRDALALARLHLASWHATYGTLLPRRARRSFRLTEREAAMRAALRDPARRACSWVARDARDGGARACGFVLARPGRPDGVTGRPTSGEIEALHVAPGSHGRGIGRRLLAAALADLRGAGCARALLWVLEDNGPARAFYEHLGWTRVGDPTRRPMGAHPGLPIVIEVRYALDLGPPATPSGPAPAPGVDASVTSPR